MATSKAICIRINSDEKKFLAKVAASKGMSLSAFLRSAATVEAQRTLDRGPSTGPLGKFAQTEG